MKFIPSVYQCPEASVQKSAKKAYEMAQSLCQRQTGGGVGRWQSVQNTWIIRLRTSWIDCQYAGCMLLHFGFGECAGDFFCFDQCFILQRGKNLQVRSTYKGEGMPTIVRGTSGMRERSVLSELSGLENIRKKSVQFIIDFICKFIRIYLWRAWRGIMLKWSKILVPEPVWW